MPSIKPAGTTGADLAQAIIAHMGNTTPDHQKLGARLLEAAKTGDLQQLAAIAQNVPAEVLQKPAVQIRLRAVIEAARDEAAQASASKDASGSAAQKGKRSWFSRSKPAAQQRADVAPSSITAALPGLAKSIRPAWHTRFTDSVRKLFHRDTKVKLTQDVVRERAETFARAPENHDIVATFLQNADLNQASTELDELLAGFYPRQPAQELEGFGREMLSTMAAQHPGFAARSLRVNEDHREMARSQIQAEVTELFEDDTIKTMAHDCDKVCKQFWVDINRMDVIWDDAGVDVPLRSESTQDSKLASVEMLRKFCGDDLELLRLISQVSNQSLPGCGWKPSIACMVLSAFDDPAMCGFDPDRADKAIRIIPEGEGYRIEASVRERIETIHGGDDGYQTLATDDDHFLEVKLQGTISRAGDHWAFACDPASYTCELIHA